MAHCSVLAPACADQAFWQSAVAAKPSASYKGFLWGCIMWMAVPLTLATSVGMASRALDLPLSAQEVNEGLVPPAAALELWGEPLQSCLQRM